MDCANSSRVVSLELRQWDCCVVPAISSRDRSRLPTWLYGARLDGSACKVAKHLPYMAALADSLSEGYDDVAASTTSVQ
ncbi:hypothetical protein ACLB2K_016040 [Fragaria x ananassa]